METLLAALLKKTGISRIFSGVSVDFPAVFLPNFQFAEIATVKSTGREHSRKAAN